MVTIGKMWRAYICKCNFKKWDNMENSKKKLSELSFKQCLEIYGGEVVLVGWKEVNGVWVAVYRDE